MTPNNIVTADASLLAARPTTATAPQLFPRERAGASLIGMAERELANIAAMYRPEKYTQRTHLPQVAVIGAGYWGPNLVRNFRAVAGDSLRLCCDLDHRRADAMVRQFPGLGISHDPQQVFADRTIDAVAIATPVHTHFALARAAMQAGKDVLLEKPMTSSVAEAEELIAIAERCGRVLMVDHTFLFSPSVRKVKDIIDAGQLGTLLYVDSVRINLGIFHHDVDVIWDLAPHDLSIVDYLVGVLPQSLSVLGAGHTGNGLANVAYMSLDYGNGLIANFHVNWLSPVKVRHTMLGGSLRSLIYNDLDAMEKVKVYDSGITVNTDELEGRRRNLIECRTGDVWSPHVDGGEPLRHVAAHFLDCVSTRQKPLTDGAAGLRVVRLLEAASQSLKSGGERVKL